MFIQPTLPAAFVFLPVANGTGVWFSLEADAPAIRWRLAWGWCRWRGNQAELECSARKANPTPLTPFTGDYRVAPSRRTRTPGY
ncbi:MAG: hypothetical protein IH586_02555 [Anaerolineaceae bacterium]|nr:hypothetical protein [Anaerolineaceae bacterium]